jgi:hypothetical protein
MLVSLQLTRMLRLGALAAAALALPGAAIAAYTPALTVTAAGAATTVELRLPQADDATAKVVLYAPAGFTANLSQAPGARIGTVDARVLAVNLRNADIPFTGALVVEDAAKYVSDPRAIACAGGAQHDAVWLLNLTAARQTLAVPVYVDVTEGPEAAFSALKLQLCLTSPRAARAQGGNVFGAKPYDVRFTLGGTTSPGPGSLMWLGLFVPYGSDGTEPDTAAAVESRSTARSPARLTTVARRVNGAVRVTGTVTAGGAPAAGARLRLVGGPARTSRTSLGHVTTGAKGRFSFVTRRPDVAFVRATAVSAARFAPCSGASPLAPAPCVSATLAGFTITGAPARVR